jgi:uncharacterized protein (TIGR03437 family)
MRNHFYGILLLALTPHLSAQTITSVVNGASFASGVAPTSWITILGTNLASSTATATSANLVNGYLPTTLAGVSVTIDGNPAFMYYVSPSQINVESPADSTTGTVTVAVTNSSGSASASVTLSSVLPGLFTLGSYAAAVRVSDSAIINGTGASASGYTTSAYAKPGDVLELYATGMGATATSIAPGLVFSGSYVTTATPTVTIGGATATVLYCGMVEEGLYQMNVVVPATLASGTYPVVVTQNTVSSTAPVFLSVATASLTASTVTLASSASSTATGSNITLTATVSPAAATGTVTFYNGAASIGTAAINSGTATLTTSFSNAGTLSLAAVYGGSSTYSSSASSPVTETVTSSSSTSAAAPSGTVVSVNATAGTFVIQESGGTLITVDTVSGTTYQNTVAATASTAAVGGWVAGLGTVSNGQLNAVNLAFVPTPPSFIPQSDVETTTQGTLYFGQITAVSNGVATITTSEGSLQINMATATNITLTTTASFSSIVVGATVEVNGPAVSATEYTGHQLNIGLTPAVVGQFD